MTCHDTDESYTRHAIAESTDIAERDREGEEK